MRAFHDIGLRFEKRLRRTDSGREALDVAQPRVDLDLAARPRVGEPDPALDDVEEGRFENEKWIPMRNLNGDERLNIVPLHEIACVRVTIQKFKPN